MNTLQNQWPPTYRLKRHKRAKSVKLRASDLYGLEITVPMRFSLKHLPSILEEHKNWILNQLQKHVIIDHPLPEQLQFHASNEIWSIQYIAALKTRLRFDQHTIFVYGDLTNKIKIQKKLLLWIKKHAAIVLNERLQYLSQKTGLPFATLSIRGQKTLWGSCTIHKNISLNFKLIFLPLILVDYIIIHELCHTKYLNHSASYWKLVESFDNDFKYHRACMRNADQYIPRGLIPIVN